MTYGLPSAAKAILVIKDRTGAVLRETMKFFHHAVTSVHASLARNLLIPI